MKMQRHEKVPEHSTRSNKPSPSSNSYESLPQFIRAGLTYLPKYENVRKQGFQQRFLVSELLRTKGNTLFKENEVQEACRQYEQALSIFRYIRKNCNSKRKGIKGTDNNQNLEYVDFQGEKGDDRNQIRNLKVALYNNLAACYLKLNNYADAIAACDEALALDPNQTKALYRRAKALISDPAFGVEGQREALENLKQAYILSPQDETIGQLLENISFDLSMLQQKANTSRENSKVDNLTVNQKIKNSQAKGENNSPLKSSEKSNNKKAKANNSNLAVKDNNAERSKYISTTKYDKVDKDNEVWQMLHGNQTPPEEEYDYSLSYEIDPNKKVPQEVEELGSNSSRFLETKGSQMLGFYEKTGRHEQARLLKENLKNAMAAKLRLEKISILDFERPTPRLKEVAQKLGIELKDPSIMEELKKVQEQNLKDIKAWINGMSSESDKILGSIQANDTKEKKGRKAHEESLKASAASIKTTTNNYYINNNFYSHPHQDPYQVDSHKGKVKVSQKIEEHKTKMQNHDEQQQLLSELLKDISKLNEADNRSKLTRSMNFLIVVVAIILLLATVYLEIQPKNGTALEMPGDI